MKQLIALFALTLMTSTGQAGTLIGVKSGSMPVSGAASDPQNISLIVGYEMGIGIGDVGVEGEFSRTTSDGRTISGQAIEVETNAVYATYRSPGMIYFLAKGGVISGDVRIGGNTVADDFDTTYGFGVGVSSGRLQIEWEYTQLDSDVDYVSIGVRF